MRRRCSGVRSQRSSPSGSGTTMGPERDEAVFTSAPSESIALVCGLGWGDVAAWAGGLEWGWDAAACCGVLERDWDGPVARAGGWEEVGLATWAGVLRREAGLVSSIIVGVPAERRSTEMLDTEPRSSRWSSTAATEEDDGAE